LDLPFDRRNGFERCNVSRLEEVGCIRFCLE
jgi:hypothetical protein